VRHRVARHQLRAVDGVRADALKAPAVPRNSRVLMYIASGHTPYFG
jgi:hypothetical protein